MDDTSGASEQMLDGAPLNLLPDGEDGLAAASAARCRAVHAADPPAGPRSGSAPAVAWAVTAAG